jgi:hypothetical protein
MVHCLLSIMYRAENSALQTEGRQPGFRVMRRLDVGTFAVNPRWYGNIPLGGPRPARPTENGASDI